VDVTIANDSFDEPDETVVLALSNADHATLEEPDDRATLTIVDNDNPPRVQFSSSSYSVNEDGSSVSIEVRLSAASAFEVTVDYASSDGTAGEGSDYTASSGRLTFNPGDTSQSFNVPITDDSLDEADESVLLALSNPVMASLGSTRNASLTILDDDAEPVIQFGTSGYTVNEGDGVATISVSLSSVSARPISVDYATGDGTATAGSDYSATGGRLDIAEGETGGSFEVPILDDDEVEADEGISLTLSNSSHASLGMANASLTILDDDLYQFYLPLILRSQ
jgi:hypothetical protein